MYCKSRILGDSEYLSNTFDTPYACLLSLDDNFRCDLPLSSHRSVLVAVIS